jgi:hypothetical protein
MAQNIGIQLQIFSKVGFKRIFKSFAEALGTLSIPLQVIPLFLTKKFSYGLYGFLGFVLLSAIFAIAKNYPRRVVSQKLSSPDTMVEIKVGDIFDEKSHIVIGTNDVFDTELGDIIKPMSVQGQFLQRIYGNDRKRLDEDIERELVNFADEKLEDHEKMKGKRIRYPIGTTITLGNLKQQYFLVAYGHMDKSLHCTSRADFIWQSLSNVWESVRRQGQGEPVAIAVIGSDLARTGLPRMTLIRIILTSFIVASKEKFVARKLTVVIHPKDLDSVDIYGLKDCLSFACF